MSVPSATAAASTRPRKDSRTPHPKVRESMTPKQSQIEGIEEFQRKRRASSKSSSDCCILCIFVCFMIICLWNDISGSLEMVETGNNNPG